MSLEEKEIESKSPSPNSHIDHQMSEEVTTKINLFESDSPSPNSHIDHQKSAEVITKINLFESESLSPNDIDHKPNDHEMSEEVTTTIRQNQCTCKFSPDHWTYRYLILMLICTVKISQNYVFDIPAGLEQVIIQTLNIDVSRYSLLYSVYSWPNIILTVAGGMIVDRILGIRLGTFMFMAISTVGQLILAIGAFCDTFWLMVVARFVIGVGGELALITTDAFAALWFKGKEIAFVFAVLGAFCRLGGAGGLYLNQLFYDKFNFISDKHTQLGVTLLIPFGLLLLSCISTIFLACLDKRAENILKREKPKGKWFSFKDLKSFGINYWLVVGVSVVYFATMFPFVSTSQIFFTSKFGISLTEANIASVLTYAVPVTAPLFGLIIDWTGFNVYWGLLGITLMSGAHLLFLLSNGASYVPFLANTIIGLSHSCFNTAMWVAPAVLVDNHLLATSYGVLEAFLSAGYAVVDLVIGQLIDKYGYFAQEVFFLCFLAIGILITVLLILRLSNTENHLNMSGWKRRKALISKELRVQVASTSDSVKEESSISELQEVFDKDEDVLEIL